jgi:hypothetical protein
MDGLFDGQGFDGLLFVFLLPASDVFVGKAFIELIAKRYK